MSLFFLINVSILDKQKFFLYLYFFSFLFRFLQSSFILSFSLFRSYFLLFSFLRETLR